MSTILKENEKEWVKQALTEAMSLVRQWTSNLENKVNLVNSSEEKKAESGKQKILELSVPLSLTNREEGSREEGSREEGKLSTVKYSFVEEHFFAQAHYGSSIMDHQQLWYKEEKKYRGVSSAFTEEEKSKFIEDAEAEIISVKEAHHSYEKVQYAFLVGAPTDISFKDRRKLSLFFMFHKEIFGLFESTMTITRDVNYSFVE